MMETWKEIPRYVGRYAVSSYGQVKRLARNQAYGSNGRQLKERLMRTRSAHGYIKIGLYNDLGERTLEHVAALMLEAFIGPRPNNGVVRHLNDVRNDNRLDNLTWGSIRDNAEDAIRNGVWPLGHAHGHSKLSVSDLAKIRATPNAHQGGISARELAEKYGVSDKTIHLARRGVTYART